MLSIDISADISRAQRKLYRMRDREVRGAGTVALNRSITTVRNEITKDLKETVGEHLGLGASGLKKSLRITRASAAAGRLWAGIFPSGKALPLINFKARQTATGVSHSAWGKRQVAKGAFIATMPGGHKGVFRRVNGQYLKRRTKGRPATSSANLPIKEMWGPSLPKEFVRPKINWRMKKIALREFYKNFQHELDRRLKKIK